jgi:hypothetical protein
MNDQRSRDIVPTFSLREAHEDRGHIGPDDFSVMPLGPEHLVLQRFPERGPKTATSRRIRERKMVDAFRGIEGIEIYGSADFCSGNPSFEAKLLAGTSLVGRIARKFPSTLIGSQASVIRALHLALRLEFKTVVFVGVDLVLDEEYEARTQRKTSGLAPVEAFHSSAIKRHRYHLPAQDLIGLVAATLAGETATKLYVGNKQSLLADHLPLYSWN